MWTSGSPLVADPCKTLNRKPVFRNTLTILQHASAFEQPFVASTPLLAKLTATSSTTMVPVFSRHGDNKGLAAPQHSFLSDPLRLLNLRWPSPDTDVLICRGMESSKSQWVSNEVSRSISMLIKTCLPVNKLICKARLNGLYYSTLQNEGKI